MSDRVNLSSHFFGRLAGAVFGFALILAGATGCEERIEVRGNLPHQKILSSIKPGLQNRQDVEAKLGPPSAVATFDKETWYYIGGRVKTVSFFTPEVLERKIVTIRFNKKGVVESVKEVNGPTSTDIKIVDRETPTKGKELTLLQQLIGNIGRFNSNKSRGEGGGS